MIKDYSKDNITLRIPEGQRIIGSIRFVSGRLQRITATELIRRDTEYNLYKVLETDTDTSDTLLTFL